jgi:hypothetical protein
MDDPHVDGMSEGALADLERRRLRALVEADLAVAISSTPTTSN